MTFVEKTPRLSVASGKHDSPCKPTRRVSLCEIKIDLPIVTLEGALLPIPAQSEVERQPSCDLPVILCKEALTVALPGCSADTLSARACYLSKQHLRER